MKNFNIELVQIEWIDSKGIISNWEFIEDIEPLKPCKCISVGYLVDNNKEYKTIVQSLSETQLIGRMTIPTCSICLKFGGELPILGRRFSRIISQGYF